QATPRPRPAPSHPPRAPPPPVPLQARPPFAREPQPYPPDVQVAARAGTLKPNDETGQNPSYAAAAGGVVSTANDLVTCMQALVGGRLFNVDYQRRWLDSLRPEDPSKPQGHHYEHAITPLPFPPNPPSSPP